MATGFNGKKRPTKSMRTSLIRNATLLVAIPLLCLLVFSQLSTRKINRIFARETLETQSRSTVQHLEALFLPVGGLMSMTSKWVRNLESQENQSISARDFFGPILLQVPQIESIIMANEYGRALYYKYEDTHLIELDIQSDGRVFSHVLDELDGRFVSIANKDHNNRLNVRDHPWFAHFKDQWKSSQGSEELIHWTELEPVFGENENGITALISIKNRNNAIIIAGFKVSTASLSPFSGLQEDIDGVSWIMSSENKILGLTGFGTYSAIQHLSQPDGTIVPGGNLPLIMETCSEVARDRKLPQNEVFSFEKEGEVWWANLVTFPLFGTDNHWTIGTLISETYFHKNARAFQVNLIWITLGGICLAALVALFLAGRLSAPLADLVTSTDTMARFEFDTRSQVKTYRIREFRMLQEEQERMKIALQSFSRYMPVDLVSDLYRKGEAARIGGQRKHVTVLFINIPEYDEIASQSPPNRVHAILSAHFTHILPHLEEAQINIAQLVRDEIMAFAGAPQENLDATRSSIYAALKITSLNVSNSHQPPLPTQAGLTRGEVVVGNFGAPSRLNFTVVGKTVNLASRLKSLNPIYGTNILANEEVVRDSGQNFHWRKVDRIRVKGFSHAVDVYEPLGPVSHVPRDKLEFAHQYAKAWDLYAGRHFHHAIDVLSKAPQSWLDDRSWNFLKTRCETFLAQPPDLNWDGSYTILAK